MDSGTWSFLKQNGTYSYDVATGNLFLSSSGDVAKVVVAEVGPSPHKPAPGQKWDFSEKLRSIGIYVHEGSIMKDIQTRSARQKVFVLPSQLNAAEYCEPD